VLILNPFRVCAEHHTITPHSCGVIHIKSLRDFLNESKIFRIYQLDF
jgi:hypothetical protein